jgi:hypothetical protein
MNKQIIRFISSVKDNIDLHATRFPVGSIFSPEGTAFNPFYLGNELNIDVTNIYITLPPEERNGRILWNYIHEIIDTFPNEILQKGFKPKPLLTDSDKPMLRTAFWSVSAPAVNSFYDLGLTDEKNYQTGNTFMAIAQIRNSLKDIFTEKLSDFSGKDDYHVKDVETPELFDAILRKSGEVPFFESLEPLREKYHQIGPNGVWLHLSKTIDAETRLLKFESELHGRDISTLSENEQNQMFQILTGITFGKER